MTSPSWPLSLPSPQGEKPVFTVGIVYGDEGPKPGVLYRGTYLYEPSKLLAHLMERAEGDDWRAQLNAKLAEELRDAISVAEDRPEPHHQNRSAA